VRRLTSYLVLAAALLPAALVSVMGSDARAEAMRCAIACGHALGATKGEACCPMGGPSEDGPAWRLCPGNDGQGAVPPMNAQPAILVSRFRLALVPSMLRSSGPAPEPLSRPPAPPDHVPLLLS
jgi:hypothetical protein